MTKTVHDQLDALIALLHRVEQVPGEFLEQAQALRARLGEGRLHLAVLGQFKRGKSTVINALLGKPLLPDGVLPVTAVPAFLYAGSRPALHVYTEDAEGPQEQPLDTLPDYVTESGNPQNRRHVRRVHLFFPSPLLQAGIVLIDTPGIGSTNENNTETTLRFLPHCDAAIVVFSADPPITAAEVDFLKALQPHVAHFFYVLNKVDYLSEAETATARHFLRDVLQRELGGEPQLFALSARQGLAARRSGDHAGWQASGMAEFDEHLRAFAHERRQAVLAQAVQRKAVALLDELGQLLALRREALQLPLAELEQKIAAFHTYAQTARQQRADVDDRLVGDEKRLRAGIESSAGLLRQQAAKGLAERLAALDLDLPREAWAGQAEDVTAALFDRARTDWRQQVRQELETVAVRRAGEVAALRDQLRREAADLLNVPHAPPLEAETLIDLPDPVWVSGTFVPLPQEAPTWERLLPAASRRQRQTERRQELVQELVNRNAERVRWWLLQMVQESIRHLRGRLSETVEQTITQIELALASAHHQHEAGAESREAALATLIALGEELQQLRQALLEEDNVPIQLTLEQEP